MKKNLLITILATLTISVVAQTTRQERQQRQRAGNERSVIMTERGVDDPRAHAILNDVRRNLNSFRSLRIEFTFTFTDVHEQTNESHRGTILLRGDRYNLKFMEQNIISDGRTVWSFNSNTNEVHINQANSRDTEMFNPIALLNNYEENFRAILIREDVERGVPAMIIDLRPFEARTYHKVRVITDKARHTIMTIEIHEKGGTILAFRVDRMQTNVPAPDSEFRFNASGHPGVEVVDMR